MEIEKLQSTLAHKDELLSELNSKLEETLNALEEHKSKGNSSMSNDDELKTLREQLLATQEERDKLYTQGAKLAAAQAELEANKQEERDKLSKEVAKLEETLKALEQQPRKDNSSTISNDEEPSAPLLKQLREQLAATQKEGDKLSQEVAKSAAAHVELEASKAQKYLLASTKVQILTPEGSCRLLSTMLTISLMHCGGNSGTLKRSWMRRTVCSNLS